MKYVVKDTPIKLGIGEEARIYEPGEIIELSKEEAKTLGGSVEPDEATGKNARKKKDE